MHSYRSPTHGVSHFGNIKTYDPNNLPKGISGVRPGRIILDDPYADVREVRGVTLETMRIQRHAGESQENFWRRVNIKKIRYERHCRMQRRMQRESISR